MLELPEILALEKKLIDQALYESKGNINRSASKLLISADELKRRMPGDLYAFEKGMQAIILEKAFMWSLASLPTGEDQLDFLISDSSLNELIRQEENKENKEKINQKIASRIYNLDNEGKDDQVFHRNTEELMVYMYVGLVLELRCAYVYRDECLSCREKSKRCLREFAQQTNLFFSESKDYILFKARIEKKLGLGSLGSLVK